jgi:hypothetical protein
MYTTDSASDPYKVSRPAKIAHSTAFEGPAEGAASRTEAWLIQPDMGGRIEVTLTHEVGTASWSTGTSTPYSVAEPDLHRIYRWRQLAEVVMSDGMSRSLNGDIEVSSDIDELAAAFDGSERLLAVMALPTYYRDVFVP